MSKSTSSNLPSATPSNKPITCDSFTLVILALYKYLTYLLITTPFYTVSEKWCCGILAITLPNLNRFPNFCHRQIEGKISNQKCIKKFHHTLNVLLHYLVKCNLSKLTQSMHKTLPCSVFTHVQSAVDIVRICSEHPRLTRIQAHRCMCHSLQLPRKFA